MLRNQRDFLCKNCKKVVIPIVLTSAQAKTYDDKVYIVHTGIYDFPSMDSFFQWADLHDIELFSCDSCIHLK